MTSRTLVVLAMLGALLAQTSCSSDDDDGAGAAGATSSQNNVSFAVTCPAPAPCGGNPTGDWTLIHACANPPDGGFQCADGLATARGQTTGTLSLTGGSVSMEIDSELRQCGWVDGGGDSSGGSYTVTGSVLNMGGVHPFDFCVDGDKLTLIDAAAEYPDFHVLEFKRGS